MREGVGPYLEDAAAPGGLFAVSIVIALLVLASGLVFFRNTEKMFADIV